VRREFGKYFVIGCSDFLFDIATLFLFKEYLHLTPVEAVILNQALLLNYVFLMNKYWSFKAKGPTRAQIVRFYSVAAMNYGISVAWMWFFYRAFSPRYLSPRKIQLFSLSSG
jgi:putative flippase GtrA